MTRSASQPRYEVETILGARVPVRDGLELSANLWLPRAANAADPLERFPAILEMIPYGKDNWRRNSDVARGEWLARRGYALCRLDVRGTGSSPGIATDEYTAAETQDGYDTVEWLAAQPWCSGNVGMWGISYGGFTAIQVAKLRPPHLRAIVPVMATDDRYLDDVHYRGGCATVSEKSQYAVSQVAMNAMPPDPALWGDGWKEAWLDRLERTPPWIIEWLRQQRDGPYWRQGSLAPHYDAIKAAIFDIGGWMDSYVDPAFRMQAGCTAPTRTIVGPWVHDLPDSAYPGPNIDWLHELVLFFDRWLKGIDTGLDSEAAVTWFEREFTTPEPFPAVLEGRWRSTSTFPHPATRESEWFLAAGSLATTPGDAGRNTFPHRATVGTRSALSWGAGSAPNGLARDLRPQESLGTTYTTEPLQEAIEILGFPVAELNVAASAPIATVVAWLSDVAPDGTSAQVSAGVLNLTHRDSNTDPTPLKAGQAYEVRVPLRAAGYRFLPGHRIRLSVTSNYWPVLWPSPLACDITVLRGGNTASRLVLPVIPPAGGDGDVEVPTFKTSPAGVEEIGGGSEEPPAWRIVDDVIAGNVVVEVREGGTTVLPDGRSLYTSEELTMTASDAEPAHARLDTTVVYRWREHDFETEIVAGGLIASDADAFAVDLDLRVTVDGAEFFHRAWHESIPRQLV
jgi:putative CocE/NonD family hydrolase